MGAARDLLPQHARYADLCIVGQHSTANPAPSDYCLSEKLLFVTGRPVLFVPSGERLATHGRTIAVAWNSSRGAARGVNDAIPLLDIATPDDYRKIGDLEDAPGDYVWTQVA